MFPSILFLVLFSPKNDNTSKKCDELTEILYHDFVHLQRSTIPVYGQRIADASAQVSGRGVGHFIQNVIKGNSLNACQQKATFPNLSPVCIVLENNYHYDCNYFPNTYKQYIFYSA